jgi:hypothetical protein
LNPSDGIRANQENAILEYLEKMGASGEVLNEMQKNHFAPE